jgi:ATP-dependent DNA helicase RecQ
LTATATAAVQTEIYEALELKNPTILTTSSVRANLSLSVFPRQTPIKKYLTVLTLLAAQPTQTVMLYCATRGEVEFLARVLQQWRPAVPESNRDPRPILAYHGRLLAQTRQQVQVEFLRHPNVIMVATNAFGMGIDKPNIRLIIHIQLPSNLENYAQEIGRAGRDNLPARAVLLASDVDWQLQLEMAQRQPDHQRKMAWLREFILTQNCRQQTLATYFGETVERCQKCDVCTQPTQELGLLWPDRSTWELYQKLSQLNIPYPSTLKFIALTQPKNFSELQQLPGIGKGWVERWGKEVLMTIKTFGSNNPNENAKIVK